MSPVSISHPARRVAARPAAACAVRPSITRAEQLEPRVMLAVFTVTTAADDGPGSLRQAIVQANTLVGADQIQFNIPGPGVHTISPLSPLPEITGPTTVDGKTQPRLPWNSWQRPYTLEQPTIWFHDVLHADGTPYRQAEVDMIRAYSAAPKGIVPATARPGFVP